MEVGLIKNLLHNLPEYKHAVPAEQEALERIAAVLLKQDQAARDASAAAVVPVKHTLKIEPIQ
ncbi:MAG: hypothetical protein NTY19_12855 [Planctomycetota bacterium]|nr:hypothetical protein [Planctomycetota bacterium]